MKDMYINGTYLTKNPTWHVEDSAWKARQIIKIMDKNNIKPNSVCEVGCGAGEILNQLYNYLPEKTIFEGYEISPQAFKLCQMREKERLKFNLKDFSEDKKFFDLILAIDICEHIEDYFSFLRNLNKKGKYKIIHVPLDLSVQSILRTSPILRWRKNRGHIHYFTKEIILVTLINIGYDIIDYFYTDVIFDLKTKTKMATLAKNPLKIMHKLNKDLAVKIFGGSSLMILTK